MTDTNTAAGLELALNILRDGLRDVSEWHPVDADLSATYTAAIAAVDAAAAELQRLAADRDALAARLAIEYDSGPAEHLYAGDCPDRDQPGARDPACPACLVMLAAAPRPAAEPARQPLVVQQFSTSDAARAEVRAFFADHLMRHDFSDYIAHHLAGDFACAIAPALHAIRTVSQPPVAEPARQPLPHDGCGACGDACRARGSCRLADESPAAEPLPTIRAGRYRHYEGGEYRVLGVVRHSESLAPMVVYRSLGSDGGDWVRPFGMFFETVEHEGQRVPRFELLEDEPAPQALTAAQRELLAALRHIRGAALDIAVERTAIARAASDAIAKAEKGGAA